jgi:acetyl/propionyl-CoA carboxylase alpha subunit
MSDKKPISFQVRVNEFDFTFTQEDVDATDFFKLSSTTFHLLKNYRSTNAVLIEADETGKQQVLEINSEEYRVQIKDELDQMIDTMGFSTDAGKLSKEVKAPMPGLVLQVHITEGQQVKEGDKLLVLVAMKMENSILVHTDAVIKHVAVRANQSVDKGQLLVELE